MVTWRRKRTVVRKILWADWKINWPSSVWSISVKLCDVRDRVPRPRDRAMRDRGDVRDRVPRPRDRAMRDRGDVGDRVPRHWVSGTDSVSNSYLRIGNWVLCPVVNSALQDRESSWRFACGKQWSSRRFARGWRWFGQKSNRRFARGGQWSGRRFVRKEKWIGQKSSRRFARGGTRSSRRFARGWQWIGRTSRCGKSW